MSQRLEKLRGKQHLIAKQIRREENRLNAQKRKEDTRRKILAGAASLHECERLPEYGKWFMHTKLNGFLTKADDRALFGLPPLPEAPAAVPVTIHPAEELQ